MWKPTSYCESSERHPIKHSNEGLLTVSVKSKAINNYHQFGSLEMALLRYYEMINNPCSDLWVNKLSLERTYKPKPWSHHLSVFDLLVVLYVYDTWAQLIFIFLSLWTTCIPGYMSCRVLDFFIPRPAVFPHYCAYTPCFKCVNPACDTVCKSVVFKITKELNDNDHALEASKS